MRTGVPILDPTALAALDTKVLLGRLQRLRLCEESAAVSDAYPDEVAQAEGIVFKDTPEWRAAYAELRQILAGREHVIKGREARTARLEHTKLNRTAEHRRRR